MSLIIPRKSLIACPAALATMGASGPSTTPRRALALQPQAKTLGGTSNKDPASLWRPYRGHRGACTGIYLYICSIYIYIYIDIWVIAVSGTRAPSEQSRILLQGWLR